jgi:hypothetical protein
MNRLLKFAAHRGALALILTLIAGGLFKLSAFVRESFITAHFGLTPLTDSYFSLQHIANQFIGTVARRGLQALSSILRFSVFWSPLQH